MTLPLRVAVVGAGPAGIYASDILTKNDPDVTVDIYDRLPTPYGLIRYGVAPDHPRIKQIIVALHRVMENPRITFTGNVQVGADVKVDELRQFYDAVIFATGAERDRPLSIPGIDLPRSYGGADFVAFYDSHPDRPQDWDLSDASSVAVIGVGNVGLDVARMLARSADELLYTEIPQHVYDVLRNSAVTDVHIFARRGPAQAKFTPVELRELDHSPNVQVVVSPEGMEFDEASEEELTHHKSLRMVVDVLSGWAMRDPEPGPHRRIHIHFLENPVEILGTDGVEGLRTEHMELTGDGNVRGSGQFTDWPVQAVYRCVGYRSEADRRAPVRPRATRAAQRRRPGHRRRRRPHPRRLRHRLGQARTGGPDRAHQVRRRRDDREPARRRRPSLPRAPHRERDGGTRPAARQGSAGHRLRRLGPARGPRAADSVRRRAASGSS